MEEFEAKNVSVGVLATANEDVRSLREMVIYGLKGMAAYTEHAINLGLKTNPSQGSFRKRLLQPQTTA